MNIGRLIDAFEKSPEKDNTIIVLWSDHGYHLGEKGHHKKQTLWEEASDVPYIWVVPGMTEPGSICNKPVDLQSMYPTLMKLVGLDVPDHVDGDDIRPLLEDANAHWDGVATVTVRYKNHAIVSYTSALRIGSPLFFFHFISFYFLTPFVSSPLYSNLGRRAIPLHSLCRWV